MSALLVLAACADDPARQARAVGNQVHSQMRGYDLGPPFPAGLRDSGLVNGYAEGEWIPFVAVMEGKKLEDADALEGGTGDGQYRLGIILPTHSARHAANGICDLAVVGTYGEGAITPIPSPFDTGWLDEHGYFPFVLGAWADGGEVDLAPVILGVAQRTGPTRFGGDVSSVSVDVRFALAAPADNVELRFAVRLAPPGLQPITPEGQGFPAAAAGDALGAADFFPGPGPLFVGYEVGEPTGIATVPIRVERSTCVDDSECIAGDLCSPDGECVHPCVSDATCPTGELCEDGLCVPPPTACIDDAGCSSEEVCVGGFCVPLCIETPCSDPELCDPDPCAPPDGEDPPCITDDQCRAEELCEDGVCIPPSPPCDVSCPTEFVCDEGLCLPPETPCVIDLDCPGGELCVGDVCVPGLEPCLPGDCPPCSFDGDCPGGEGCEGGVCIPLSPPLPCTTDGECPSGQLCEDGFCTPPPEPCGPSGECPIGELCEHGGDGSHCVPEHPPIPCATAADCPSGDVCVEGFCTPPDPSSPCNNDNQCEDTHQCVDGVCVPPPGTTHPPVPCATALDCPAGDSCVSGWCEPPDTCTNDDDCPGGELCQDGRCRPGQPPIPCETAADCPPPSGDDVYPPTCYGGFCTPSEGSCFDDWGCPGGTLCDGSSCIDADPPPACVSSWDCGPGELCRNGYCEPQNPPEGCTTNEDCPPHVGDDVPPVCIDGVCNTSLTDPAACGSDADCNPGRVCVAGACQRVEGACDLAADCPAGEACLAGWCGVACTTDAECGADLCAHGRCVTRCAAWSDCGPFEACLEGGCVPMFATVAGGGGAGDSAWTVELPGDPHEPVAGGCSAAPARSAGTGAAAVVAGALLLLLAGVARRRRAAIGVVALYAFAASPACGAGDDAAGDDDAVVDAAPPAPDAALPAADAAAPTSPFLLVTCEGEAPALPDAGAESPDGGLPPGTDSPCCAPDGACPGGLACIEGPDPATHRCRPRCDLTLRACPPGGVCASFGAEGVCIPASLEGQPCAPELCDGATICVGMSADDAVCRLRCEDSSTCPDGTTCQQLSGADAMACL